MNAFSINCHKKQFLFDKKYILIFDNKVILLSTLQTLQNKPKYTYPLNSQILIDWKVIYSQHNTIQLEAFSISNNSKPNQKKWFYAKHQDLLDFKKIVGPYVLFSNLGELFTPLLNISSTNVFKAKNNIDQQIYAVKRVKFSKSAQNQEIPILQKRMRNVVKLFEVFYLDDYYFLVMEYLQRGSLRYKLESYNFEMNHQQVIEIMKQILTCLEEIHSNNLVHLNIKPENFMLNDDQQLKLINFKAAGLARSENQSKVFGTPGYIAHEILNSNPIEITPKCDIFSAGCIFYRMLTKKELFGGDSIEEILIKNKECEINLGPIGSMEAQLLVGQMLNPDPQKRISASEALKHAYFNLPSSISPVNKESDFSINCHINIQDYELNLDFGYTIPEDQPMLLVVPKTIALQSKQV